MKTNIIAHNALEYLHVTDTPTSFDYHVLSCVINGFGLHAALNKRLMTIAMNRSLVDRVKELFITTINCQLPTNWRIDNDSIIEVSQSDRVEVTGEQLSQIRDSVHDIDLGMIVDNVIIAGFNALYPTAVTANIIQTRVVNLEGFDSETTLHTVRIFSGYPKKSSKRLNLCLGTVETTLVTWDEPGHRLEDQLGFMCGGQWEYSGDDHLTAYR